MEFPSLKRYFQQRKVFQRVVRELSYYSDSELRELGFERCDIARIARETAQQS